MSAITSIIGLQNLPNLADFRADYNYLQTINLSGLTNLTYVDISDCDLPDSNTPSLTSVNVTGCTALEELRIDDSDFSAGFPDLSTCTSLRWIDADQSRIQGTLNLSNIPSLNGIDLYGNRGLTNLIISSTQPIGDGRSLDCNDTSLNQASIDSVLHALASGSVDNGEFNCEDGFQDYPSPYGVEAIRVLNGRGWTVNPQQYSDRLILTSVNATGGDACSALLANNVNDPGGYIHKDTIIEVGTPLYDDSRLLTPLPAGWYGVSPDGITLEVDSDGVITQITACV